MAFCQIAYVSDVEVPCAPDDLSQLVACARRNNVRDGITGILLSGRAGFIQLIEGPRMAVLSLFERLENDPRHRNMVILHKGDTHLRTFPDRPLCLQQADQDSLQRLEKALPVLSAGLCSQMTADAIGLI